MIRKLILPLLIIAAAAIGCTADDTAANNNAVNNTEEGRVPSTGAPDQSIVDDALRFGSVVLPPGAEVVGAAQESGIDQLYTLAVTVDQGSVDALLAESGFDTPLQLGRQVFMPPAPGFTPATGDAISSAQDRRPGDGDGPAVTREILVDRTDPTRPTVHIWAFTT